MKLTLRQSILATVSYADIFSYPLTRQELMLWMLFRKPDTKALTRELQAFFDSWEKDGLYCFKGNTARVLTRQARDTNSGEKWIIANRVARTLHLIPTVKLIGVTGALSLNNATDGDDIDLFFIVEKGTLWVSRFLTTLAVEIMGVRRRPNDTRVKNKICLNMFMAEDALELPASEHDAFAAHEIVQMQPLWQRGHTYKKFLSENGWVKMFLPAVWEKKFRAMQESITNTDNPGSLFPVLISLMRWTEAPMKRLQLLYMKKKRTNEIISQNILRFHPRDMRVRIRKEWAKRLRPYNIPLDKVFYGS